MKRWFLFVTAFCTGVAVMGLEMAASRYLAPYFGTTIFVWANVIGLVLLALSVGYFVGGKLADRHRDPKKLYLAIFLAGVLADAAPFLGGVLFQTGLQSIGEIPGSFIFMLVLFAVPLFLLGMTSPWLIRLATSRLEEVGKISGLLFAISTIGSILGIFLPVFVTIPFLGTQKTIFIFGSLLIFVGILGMASFRWSWLMLPVLSLSFLLYPEIIFQHGSDIVARAESSYNFLKIRKIGEWLYLQENEGRGVQSAYHPTEILTGRYWDYAALPPLLNPAGKKYLIIGLGAGTSSRIIRHYFPDVSVAGVEIDEKILDLGKKYFALDRQNVGLAVSDGRRFLASSREKYDFIMVDVYTQEHVIPFHLATREFFELAKRNLAPNGIILMNVAIFGERPNMFEPLQNTFTSVFDNAVAFPVPDSTNIFLMAFQNPDAALNIPKNIPNGLGIVARTFQAGRQLLKFNPEQLVFTDDKAPIEWLTR